MELHDKIRELRPDGYHADDDMEAIKFGMTGGSNRTRAIGSPRG